MIGRVLIVADEPEILPVIRSALLVFEAADDHARSLGSARVLFAKHRYDLVLLDLKTPAADNDPHLDEDNGEFMLKFIHNHPNGKETPVILMTSHHRQALDRDFRLNELGMDTCVPKPFTPACPLAPTIEAVMLKRQAAAATIADVGPATLPANVFRLCGGTWQVRFQGGEVFTLRPMLGATYLHYLLSAPGDWIAVEDLIDERRGTGGREISVEEALDEGLNIADSPMVGGAETITDLKGLAQMRKASRQMERVIEAARESNNNVEADRLEAEKDTIDRRIREAVGRGGRLRTVRDKRKTMLDRVRNNIPRVINQQIRANGTDHALADHLDQALSFGKECRYAPAGDIEWETTRVQNG